MSDIRAEEALRADEIAARRETEKARHLSMVEDLYAKSLTDRFIPGSGAYAVAAKSLEMRAKILGIDAPSRVEVGVESLVQALVDLPD